MANSFRVVHFMPGRLRLRLDALHNAPELARRVEEEFGRVPGVKKVEAKSLTGSVLLEYESSALGNRQTQEALRLAVSRLFSDAEVRALEGYLARLA